MRQRGNRRGVLLVGLIAVFASVGALSPVRAQVSTAITANQAPPPPRYERVPPPRAGYQWAPGYWRWDAPARRYAWVGGYWVQRRGTQRYVPERWVPHQGRWRLQPGRWER